MKPTYVKPVLEKIIFEDKQSIAMDVGPIKTYVSENVLNSCFSDAVQALITAGTFDPTMLTQAEIDSLQPDTFQAS